ncbi:hypothetical protein WG936_05370 [Corynebacterium sp. H127]|uniref:hypothetical protein n=1 Tax=Corynebacterium sp. H127 TaxID=3133418 RepID=UPI0030AAAA43
MIYRPLVAIDCQEPTDIKALEQLLQAKGCTHVEDNAGAKWRMFQWLNKKSVPINQASAPHPQRIPWKRVKSFGIFDASVQESLAAADHSESKL